MKVCSLYGAGFYYIPGTDTCLKIGGYVRADFNMNSAPTHAAYTSGANARHTRSDSNDIMTRARGVVSFDARSQTEWGTLRSYTKMGWQSTSGAEALYTERAFIQLGGFTFGKASSFFDFYAGALGYATFLIGSDTAGSGKNVWAYTAQFGNGFSATISLEDPTTTSGAHRKSVTDLGVLNTFAITSTGVATADNRGAYIPDVVGVLRLDQAWGSAQLSAAIHDASGAYYGTFEGSGHPGDKLGWAVQGGVAFNLPFAAGDKLFLQAGYAEGFTGANTQATGFTMYGGGTSVGVGFITDGVFGTGSIELTKSWSALAGIEHNWAPNLKTSVYGGYVKIDYNANATTLICANMTAAGAFHTVSNCEPDFSYWQVGTRTQWTPVRNFDVGVEVLYTKLNTAFAGTATLTANGAKPADTYKVEDQGTWSGLIRVQRNFWP